MCRPIRVYEYLCSAPGPARAAATAGPAELLTSFKFKFLRLLTKSHGNRDRDGNWAAGRACSGTVLTLTRTVRVSVNRDGVTVTQDDSD